MRMNDSKLAIYQAKDGSIELPIDATNETIWASQRQIAEVFDVAPQNVTMHIANIYKEDELTEKATCKDSLQVQQEGGREVKRNIKLYNLDMVIAVGYRISSGKGTNFRKWATKTLSSYITDGFVINPARIEHNRSQFTKALQDLKLLAAGTDQVGSTESTDLALAFASTWLSLDAYDKEELPSRGNTKQSIDVASQDLQTELAKLKIQLI